MAHTRDTLKKKEGIIIVTIQQKSRESKFYRLLRDQSEEKCELKPQVVFTIHK